MKESISFISSFTLVAICRAGALILKGRAASFPPSLHLGAASLTQRSTKGRLSGSIWSLGGWSGLCGASDLCVGKNVRPSRAAGDRAVRAPLFVCRAARSAAVFSAADLPSPLFACACSRTAAGFLGTGATWPPRVRENEPISCAHILIFSVRMQLDEEEEGGG